VKIAVKGIPIVPSVLVDGNDFFHHEVLAFARQHAVRRHPPFLIEALPTERGSHHIDIPPVIAAAKQEDKWPLSDPLSASKLVERTQPLGIRPG
jgi:TPP-dependent pyruvate/acetoin dehydrogenase alpha subunit